VSAVRPPTRPAAGPPARRQRYRRRQTSQQTTDASEQNNTVPLGGPIITIYIIGMLCFWRVGKCQWSGPWCSLVMMTRRNWQRSTVISVTFRCPSVSDGTVPIWILRALNVYDSMPLGQSSMMRMASRCPTGLSALAVLQQKITLDFRFSVYLRMHTCPHRGAQCTHGYYWPAYT